MAVEARCFLDGRDLSARFADFVPQEMKHVALIAACPSVDRHPERNQTEAASRMNRAQARELWCFRQAEAKEAGPVQRQTEQIQ